MAFQTSYSARPAIGIAGQLADSRACEVVTRINDQGADIPFGVFVARDGDNNVDLPASSGDKIMGVAIFDQSRENRSLLTTLAVRNGSPMNVCRKGVVWMAVEDACTEFGTVFVRHTASGAGTQLGAVRGTDDSTNTSSLAGARFLSTQASAGGLALVEFDLCGSDGSMA